MKKINRYLALMKRPDRVCRYMFREAKRTLHYVNFRLGNRRNKSPHREMTEIVSAFYSCQNDTELEIALKSSSRGALFLCDRFDHVLASILVDKNYYEAILKQADCVLSNRFYMLYQTTVNTFDQETGHYKWDTDYRTGYQYQPTYFTKVRLANDHEGTDIKRIWEFARMQYLFAPALAFRLTGDERYAKKVKHILMDFIECNPLDVGPNWNVSMEVGIRVANMILAFELIKTSACVDGTFIREFVASALEHECHILRNEENYAERTSNHYLGGLLGLAAVSAFCPGAPKSAKVAAYVSRAIEREILDQIHPDGGDYEGSTSYQRLVGELILFTLIACKKDTQVLPEPVIQRLYAMLEYSNAIADVDCIVPQIGDNDCGRVFQLLPENNRCHLFYVGLLSGFLENKVPRDYKNGLECFLGLETAPYILNRKSIYSFPQSGLAVVRSDSVDLIVTANETQSYGGSGGHTHNDLLSFVLRVDGEEMITDPGTGNYTGDAALRELLRSTRAHSTVSIQMNEQRALRRGSLFAWGSKTNVKLECNENENMIVLLGAHDGYHSRYGIIHQRCYTFSASNKEIEINDSIDDNVLSCLSFTLGPKVLCVPIDCQTWLLKAGKVTIRLESTVKLELTTGVYSDGYDSSVRCSRLCGMFTDNKINTRLSWE